MAVNVNVNVRRSNKKVTDPFNEKVRARIVGNSMSYTSTSGSEHDADDVVSPSPSPCLSHLVQNFLEDEFTTSELTRECGSEFDSDPFIRPDATELIDSVINPTLWSNVDPFRNQLLAHVTKGVEIFSIFMKNKQIFNRNLMAYLREIGYNAGVCKTRWESSGGLPAGNYEFIDVILPESSATARYLVDADFAGEFEIARETESYGKLRRSLPRVFVGKSDDLKRIVRLMCDEARRSMKINGLTLPPWRKNRYMQAKWLGPYRRSTNHSPVPAMASPVGSHCAVKCRSVGFELDGDSCRIFVPPTTRTR